jgi:T5SS/PEP-CTERM-associated repeat protein
MLVIAALTLLASTSALAAVSIVGQVSPAIPANGQVTGPLFIGDTSLGTLSVFIPQPPASQVPTPVNVTSGGVFIGDDTNITGIAAFSGFGSDLSVATNLVVGNAGRGSLSASSLSRVFASDNIILGQADGSSGRIFVNDLGTTVAASNDITVARGGTALFQVLSGGVVFGETTIVGEQATADGTITVSGNESLWFQSGAMTIGSAGRAFVQVVSQARMQTTAATIGLGATGVGSANVSGTGSVWEVIGALTVASAGVGSVNVTEGGRINSTGVTRFATAIGSEGTGRVSGVNSVWNAGTQLNLGELGNAALSVSGGGRVNTGNTVLASTTGSRGELAVDGSGTVFDITGTLDVTTSPAAEGLLSVSGGGVLNTTSFARVGTGGEVFLAGGRINAGGGFSNQGLLQGAGRINGVVTNQLAGEIRTHSGSALVLGNTLNNAGLVHLNGGELAVLGTATNTGDIDARSAVLRFDNGLMNNNGGQFAIVGGAVDVLGTVTNAAGAQIVIGGEAHAVFHDTLNVSSGEFIVKPGADVLMLENLAFNPSAMLTLQLGEQVLEEDFNLVEVTGQATLAGQLNVSLSGDLTPQLGDSYQVLTASGGVSGTFGMTALPSLGPGLDWDVDYSPTSLTLSVVTGPGSYAADFDGDGDVDGADLNAWRSGFGMAGAAKDDGDADSDGDVDGSDFLTWQRQLGSPPIAAPTAGLVPEPASAVIFAAAMVGLALAVRQCRVPVIL